MSSEQYGKAKLACAIITAIVAVALMVISYGEFRGEVKGHGELIASQSGRIGAAEGQITTACQRISAIEGQIVGIDRKLADISTGQAQILNILLTRSNNNYRGTKE